MYTQLTGRAATVPLWSLGLWVSRAYYKTPEEAAAVAAKLRAHRIPCDVLTLDGRAAWKLETRVDFEWDPDRFPNPRAALAAIKAHHLRICVWEYPYVSVHSPLFADLASRGYLLTTKDGDPYVFGWDTAPGTSPFGKVLTPLPESGIVDFTHPGAYVWWRDAHAALFADGVDVIKSDFGEQVPDDAVAFNGDSGRRLHNVYPLLYNQVRVRGDGEIPARARFGADGLGARRLDRQPALSYPVGRRSAKRLGRPCRIDSRRLSWGMSGVPYHSSDIGGFYGSQQPSAELYLRWLQATVFSSHIRVHGIGEREPWAFGAEAEAIAKKWLAFRYRLDSVSAASDRGGGRDGHARDAGDGAGLSRQRAHPRLRNAVHVRRHAAGRAGPPGREAKSRSRCRRAPGTTSFRGSAFPASACCATRRRSINSRYSAAKDTLCRWAPRSSTRARSIRRSRSSSSGCSASRRGRSTASCRPTSSKRPDGTYAIGAVADVKVELFGDAAGIAVARLPD